MNFILWIVLLISEISLIFFGFISNANKKEWNQKRFLLNGIEAAAYLLMLFLPGVNFGLRWRAIAVLLFIRVIFSGIIYFLKIKKISAKKKSAMVFSDVLNFVILSIAMVPSFLFTDYTGRPVSGKFKVAQTNAILIDDSRIEEFENDGSFREVPVFFFYPESISALENNSLPLVIFSHGAFGYYQSNISTYMELASNGYVVVSLDHPYHCFVTKDTNGKTVKVNSEFFKNALTIGGSEISDSEIFEITSQWMKLREDDMNFVIDTFKNFDEKNVHGKNWFVSEKDKNLICEIFNHTDINKIGLMGHSLGGATAVTVGRRNDISAVIDFDGTMLGEITGIENGITLVNEEIYTTPLFAFDSEIHHEERILSKKQDEIYVNNVILDNATQGFSTYIEGSDHMNFTDLPLFAPGLGKLLGTGTVDQEKCIDCINKITLEFFDCYLKQTGVFTVNEKY